MNDKLQDSQKFRPKEYKRHGEGFEVVGRVTGDDLHDLLEMATDTLRKSGTCKYSNDLSGLEDFKKKSVGYLDFLREQNDNGGSLTPTVEGWCAFAGISRVTLMKYEQRSDEWGEFIGYFKNVLMACKTELASKGKLPPIVFVFDATNNGQRYYNTSEFRLQKLPEVEALPVSEDAELLASRYRSRITISEHENDCDNSETI